MKDDDRKLINIVANEISNLIPDCCGVTLGGSRCLNLNDEHSDVEMYFYTHECAPSVESITECLNKLNAKHKRTESFLWENDKPWGPHSFFVINDLYFEIGYRNIDNIKGRILNYESGRVMPESDCHDLGLGYMPSGLAASVANEVVLIKGTDELNELKQIASSFPQSLLKVLKEEYFETAKSLIDGKLLSAAERADIFLYDAIANRIIRCLMVMAFALGNRHFPGDKWNEALLLRSDWRYKEVFLELLKKHNLFAASNEIQFKQKRAILKEAFNIVQKDLEKKIEKTLYEKTLTFDNDWKEPEKTNFDRPKISVVIPVYHPQHLNEVLNHLSKLNIVDEVITVFDSLDDNPNSIINEYNFDLTIVKHDKNRNAPAANNTGAVYAKGDIVLFLDQDMILSPNFLPIALNLLNENKYKGLVVGFRDTVDFSDIPPLEKWQDANYYNDWRIRTLINDKYLDLTISNCGSATNNCQNNSILSIYEQSNKFRNLGTQKENTLGFWDLPCMVISHTLVIPKSEFLKIGGFPEWIKGWGGEDIALGFLAIANYLYVMPALVGSYHIKHEPHSGSEEQKWREMRENLKRYKIWSTTITEFPKIDEENCKKRGKVLYKSNKWR